ncbi:thiamine-binding protein [Brachybacterium sp. EF45031]|uniref:thiamine-binding protein n=1 Tax=Brachybacterium sillae TaxID=2810536 RepID=UPI00217DF45B|nr:thiamine-binding protein [Brachybacterium sillae]MCS6710954.1 thiamine-binding protein [Brachybacterium sillae]
MIVAFSVSPAGEPSDPTVHRSLGPGADSASVHDAVAAAVRIVRDSGLPHRTSSMFTEIEGEWDQVMDVVRRATEEVGRYGSRVSLVLKADIRPGRSGELDGKLQRLEAALDRAAEGRDRPADERA